MGVDVRQLRALVAVVEHGTFTDAAAALGTTQASVSRAVASLEDVLGARLLRRTARGVWLTPVGTRALDHARRILAELAALERTADPGGRDLRVGYAWSALGEHTVSVQLQWAAGQPGRTLRFVASNTPSAGLLEGVVDVAVLRRSLTDARFLVRPAGSEARYAALAATDPLARRRTLALRDFGGRTLARDRLTGTTGEHLWPAGTPVDYLETHGIEDFLTAVAAGQAVGITSAATVHQHQRPGVVYRRVRDAPPITISLAWWRDDPPAEAPELLALIRGAYGYSD